MRYELKEHNTIINGVHKELQMIQEGRMSLDPVQLNQILFRMTFTLLDAVEKLEEHEENYETLKIEIDKLNKIIK